MIGKLHVKHRCRQSLHTNKSAIKEEVSFNFSCCLSFGRVREGQSGLIWGQREVRVGVRPMQKAKST